MFDVVVDIPEPKDRKIMFKDILTDGFTDREKARAILESEERLNTCLSKMHERYKKFGNVVYLEKYKDLISIENAKLKVKTNTVDGFQYATKDDCINLSFASSTTRRGRITKGKSPCLLQGNEPLFAFTGDNIRPLNKIELCRLQGFPDDYCDILTRNKAASLLGDGWTLPIVEHIFSFMHKTKH
jgi:DNA (cytosine-5)-methyltransferase 3A